MRVKVLIFVLHSQQDKLNTNIRKARKIKIGKTTTEEILIKDSTENERKVNATIETEELKETDTEYEIEILEETDQTITVVISGIRSVESDTTEVVSTGATPGMGRELGMTGRGRMRL